MILCAIAQTAHAACSAPDSGTSDIIYNSDENVFQGCIGSTWHAFHEAPTGSASCASPSGGEGDIIYNQNIGVFQGCTSGGWMAFNAESENPDLAGYWPLDEETNTTVYDQIGSNNGTMNGSMSADNDSVTGIFNNALYFDGIDDYIDFGQNAPLDNPTGTYSIWVNTNGDWDADGADSSNSAIVFARSRAAGGGANGFTVVIARESKTVALHIKRTNYVAFCSYTAADMYDGWHMITISYSQTNGETNYLYFDGIEVDDCDNTDDWAFSSSANLRLADNGDTNREEYRGTLDDFRFYDRVLTPTEIETLYNCTNPAEKRASIIYNSSRGVFQGCTATGWVSFLSASTNYVEDFESGNSLSNGDTGSFSVAGAAAKNGSNGLTTSSDVGQVNIHNGIIYDASDNLKFSTWVRPRGVFSGSGIVLANDGTQVNGYFIFIDLRSGGQLQIRNGAMNYPGTYTSISMSENSWYWLEVEWTLTDITASLYDAPNGTELGSVIRTDNTYSSGYSGLTSRQGADFDDFTISP